MLIYHNLCVETYEHSVFQIIYFVVKSVSFFITSVVLILLVILFVRLSQFRCLFIVVPNELNFFTHSMVIPYICEISYIDIRCKVQGNFVYT